MDRLGAMPMNAQRAPFREWFDDFLVEAILPNRTPEAILPNRTPVQFLLLLQQNLPEIGGGCYNEHELVIVLNMLLRYHPNLSSLKSLRYSAEERTIPFSLRCSLLIANVLMINRSITTLDLGDVCICNDGIIAIFEALSDNDNTTLTELDFRDNVMNYTAVEAMGRMLTTNNLLQFLRIGCCHIDTDGAIVVGRALRVNTTLKSLGLEGFHGHNGIGDDGARAIANGIRENDLTSLNLLNLKRNEIGVIGARSIAAMLATNTSLTELDLGGNAMIGTDGVVAIVEALRHNDSLAKLTLDRIPFGDDGARRIATLLATNVSLKKLDIDDCNVGDAGATAIAHALKTDNNSLEFLFLCGNPFGCNVIINDIAPMLEVNTRLRQLDVGRFPVDNDAAGILLRALEEYNDTVQLHLRMCSTPGHDVNQELLDKINAISIDNCYGNRIAPLKAERNRRNIAEYI